MTIENPATIFDMKVEKSEEMYKNDIKLKRGRKPKPNDEKRSEKFSIYLTPALYEDIKDLAYFSRQEVSNIFFNLAKDYVERNRDKLCMFRNFLEHAGTIE